MNNKFSWRWMEVDASFYKDKYLEDMDEIRSDKCPIGLITKWDAKPNLVSINLLAPLGQIFWSAAGLHGTFQFTDFAETWAALIMHQYNLTEIKNLANYDPTEVKKELRKIVMATFRKSGIKAKSPQARWFNALGDFIGLSGPVISLSKGHMSYREKERFFSVIMPIDNLNNFKNHLDKELEQFGDLSFLGCDEKNHIGETSNYYWFQNGIDLLLKGVPYLPWKDNDIPNLDKKVFLHFCMCQKLKEIERTIYLLNNGHEFPHYYASPTLLYGSLALTPGTIQNGRCIVNRVDVDMDIVCQVISSQARLVRLLGWPVHYRYVKDLLNDPHISTPSQKEEFMKTMGVDAAGMAEIMSKYPFNIPSNSAIFKSLNIVKPYNAEDELRQYIEDMEKKYPILLESMPKRKYY